MKKRDVINVLIISIIAVVVFAVAYGGLELGVLAWNRLGWTGLVAYIAGLVAGIFSIFMVIKFED